MDGKKIECDRFCFFSIWLIVFLDMVGIGIVLPVLATLFFSPQGILPASYTVANRALMYGILVSLYPLMQFFGAPILGALSDRHGRRKILLVSLIGTFIGYLFFGSGIAFSVVVFLFIGRIIDGLTGGNISVAMSAIADVSEQKDKARNFGLIGMAFGLGLVIGPYIGGQLTNKSLVPWFSHSTPFFFAALLTIINMIMLYFLFPETLHTKKNLHISPLTGFRNIRKAFSLINLRVMFLVVFLLTLGFNFYTQFFQVFLIEKYNFTEVQIGNYFAYVGFWIAIAQGLITRPISAKIRPNNVVKFSILFLALALPMQLLPSKSVYIYLIAPFVAIFQGLTYPNTTAIISNLSEKDSQGEILGISQSIQSLAMAIPPIIAGLISAFYIGLPIIVAGCITFSAWLIFVLYFGKKKCGKFRECE